MNLREPLERKRRRSARPLPSAPLFELLSAQAPPTGGSRAPYPEEAGAPRGGGAGRPLSPRLRRAEAFRRFHEANPQVFEALKRLALHARARRPGARIGIRLLWERLRWELLIEVEATGPGPRLNDHHPPFYARLLNREPGLEGVFEIREHRAPSSAALAAERFP